MKVQDAIGLQVFLKSDKVQIGTVVDIFDGTGDYTPTSEQAIPKAQAMFLLPDLLKTGLSRLHIKSFLSANAHPPVQFLRYTVVLWLLVDPSQVSSFARACRTQAPCSLFNMQSHKYRSIFLVCCRFA